MSEFDCRDFVELVTEFLEGALDEVTKRRFVEHISPCSGCARHLEQFRATTGMLGGLPPESLTDDACDRLLAVFRGWQGARAT